MVVLLVGMYSEGSVWLVREVRRVLRVLGVGVKTKNWVDCNMPALAWKCTNLSNISFWRFLCCTSSSCNPSHAFLSNSGSCGISTCSMIKSDTPSSTSAALRFVPALGPGSPSGAGSSRGFRGTEGKRGSTPPTVLTAAFSHSSSSLTHFSYPRRYRLPIFAFSSFSITCSFVRNLSRPWHCTLSWPTAC